MKNSVRNLAGLLLLAVAFVLLYRRQGGNVTAPSSPGTASPSEPRQDRGERHRSHSSAVAEATPGQFDFYLLNLSWSPEFCSTHPQAAECAAHPAFVLHGLWPQNTNGSYPEHCSDAPGPANPAAFRDLYPDQGLLRHEWQTHGTCSGLAPDAFFTLARQAFHSVTPPAALTGLKEATSMTPDQVLHLVQGSNPGLPGASLALSCGNNILTALEVCLDRGLHPVACQAVRSCRANMVRIPPP